MNKYITRPTCAGFKTAEEGRAKMLHANMLMNVNEWNGLWLCPFSQACLLITDSNMVWNVWKRTITDKFHFRGKSGYKEYFRSQKENIAVSNFKKKETNKHLKGRSNKEREIFLHLMIHIVKYFTGSCILEVLWSKKLAIKLSFFFSFLSGRILLLPNNERHRDLRYMTDICPFFYFQWKGLDLTLQETKKRSLSMDHLLSGDLSRKLFVDTIYKTIKYKKDFHRNVIRNAKLFISKYFKKICRKTREDFEIWLFEMIQIYWMSKYTF